MTTATEVLALIERAHKELSASVKRQWSGKAAFRLTIPAKPEEDSDLVISGALIAAREWIEAQAAKEGDRASPPVVPQEEGR